MNLSFSELLGGIVENNGKLVNRNWIEWHHDWVPDGPHSLRELERKRLFLFGHCMICTSMSGCYYPVLNMPAGPPIHERCDCKIQKVAFDKVRLSAKVDADIMKFTNYLFNKENKNNGGKYELFTSWGYSVNDSEKLRDMINEQALRKYLAGDYFIKENYGYGTTIKISVEIDGRIFGTGWMIMPKGRIRLITPYADDR